MKEQPIYFSESGWPLAVKMKTEYAGMGYSRGFHPPQICPYGTPGDRLWVRETFGYAADGSRGIYYKADDVKNNWVVEKWRPSIHMPRCSSRLTLEIESVRVERLQDISENDARAEGITIGLARWGFVELWDSINAERGHGWATNPWVWVVEFKKL